MPEFDLTGHQGNRCRDPQVIRQIPSRGDPPDEQASAGDGAASGRWFRPLRVAVRRSGIGFNEIRGAYYGDYLRRGGVWHRSRERDLGERGRQEGTQLQQPITIKQNSTNITLSGIGQLKSSPLPSPISWIPLSKPGAFNKRAINITQSKDDPAGGGEQSGTSMVKRGVQYHRQ